MNRDTLERAGFSEEQIEALCEVFSPLEHMHDIEDIHDLPEELGLEDDDD